MTRTLQVIVSLSLTLLLTFANTVAAAARGFSAADGLVPLHFEPNVGQASPEQKYVASGNRYKATLTDYAVTLSLSGSKAQHIADLDRRGQGPHDTIERNASLSLSLTHALSHPRMLEEQKQTSVTNYFIGTDRSKWHSNVANFGAIRYQSVYPGIDWVIYGNPQQLEYDFVVAPHADPGKIKLEVKGADHLSLNESGDLRLQLGDKTMLQLRPAIYQISAEGNRQRIDGHYVLRGRTVSFVVGKYNPNSQLIIDPVLAFSTYLGGSVGDYAYGTTVDATGSVYVVGQTASADFPTINPFQGANSGDNAFVAKFNATGSALVFATYLGGSGGDSARAVAVDSTGSVYVTGWTFSSDFPTVNAFQSKYNGTGEASNQAFVTKLDATGGALVYSTYLGGSGSINEGFAIAVDATGSAYVAGATDSTDFPQMGGLQNSLRGRLNGYVTKFSPDGRTLSYSTYLGGSAADQVYALAIDGAGDAYVSGVTNSADFPLVNAYQSVNKAIVGGGTHSTAFISKLNSAGSALLYSTYLGGSISDSAQAIAVDNVNSAYVAGQTCSTDFPTVDALQSANNSSCASGGSNAFVTKFDSAGSGLVFSTYLGGSGSDVALGIAVDSGGSAVVVGSTTSQDFPLANSLQGKNMASAIGASNAFVSQFNVTGEQLSFSTYWGGSGSWGPSETHTTIPFGDSAAAVALDGAGNIYFAGQTGSADFPTASPFQATNKTATVYGTGPTAFVTKIAQQLATPIAAPLSVTATGGVSEVTLTWSAVSSATSYDIYQGTVSGGENAVPIRTLISGTTEVVTGLTNGTTYYYEVTAVNADGESARSSEVSATATMPATAGGGGSAGWEWLIALGLILVMRVAKAGAGLQSIGVR